MHPRHYPTQLTAGLVVACTVVLTGSALARASHDGAAHPRETVPPSSPTSPRSMSVSQEGADIQCRQEGVDKALVEVACPRHRAVRMS